MSKKGIDVSHWDGSVNWAKVAAAGYSFAIIKAGGSDAGYYRDSKYETNYSGATAAGIEVGAYYFAGTGLVSATAGRDQAAHFLALIAGKKFSYPVYLDIEAQATSAKTKTTTASIAFLERLENAGYYAGVYASAVSGFKERLDDSRLTSYDHWVAQYANSCTYSGDIGIWQHSSTGKVSGISTNCDLDIAYKDYPTIIKAAGLNGYTATSSTSSTSSSALDIDGAWGPATSRALQTALCTTCDGVISSQNENNKAAIGCARVTSWEWVPRSSATGSACIRALQALTGAAVDGLAGPATAKALQTYLDGLGYDCGGVDGKFGVNSCKALQRALNAGALNA